MKAFLAALILMCGGAVMGQARVNPISHRPPSRSRSDYQPAFSPRSSYPPVSGIAFANPVQYDSGGYSASSVAAADLNGDGKLDLVIANGCASGIDCSQTNGSVGILLGNGDGTFQAAVSFGTGGQGTSSVVVADLNGDGKLDIAVANACINGNSCSSGAVGVLLGNGDGTFKAASEYSSGGSDAQTIVVADVNGDDNLDLLVTNGYDSNVGVLLGNGDGTFQPAVTYGTGGNFAQSLVVMDVNGDGKKDLIVGQCNECVGANQPNYIAILLGAGDGTFHAWSDAYTEGFYNLPVAVADVNGDGKPDLVFVDNCLDDNCDEGSYVGVSFGNGDGTFQDPTLYEARGAADAVALSDIDGDGHLDIIVGGGSLSVLTGNGDGTFQQAVALGVGGVDSLWVADINGDGKPDLLGTLNYNNSDGGLADVLINIGGSATTTNLTSSLNPSSSGQSVSFTATVKPVKVSGVPTGTVNFVDGTTSLGTSTLNSSGVATLSTSTLTVGTHPITAAYSGDTNFAPSTSPVLNQVVQGSIGTASPLSVDLGARMLGLPSGAQYVTFTNTGNIAMTISTINISGTNSSDFSEVNSCPASLGPNVSCTVTLIFTPSGIGERTATLNFVDSAINSPQTVSLTGDGTPPVVSFSPTNLVFNNQPVGTTSPPQVVTLLTGGTLIISSITASSQYTQTNNCGTGLPAGGSCEITITFTPTMPGLQNGSISVSDDGVNSPQMIPVTGTATQPAVTLTPPSLSFGNQTVGIASLPSISILTNIGNGTLNISSIVLGGANGADFSEQNNCPPMLQNSTSCKITVTFKPKATGNRVATVTITDNAPGSPHVLPLTGVGVLPAIIFSPTSLTFPDQTIFTTSPPQKVMVTNTGLGILNFTGAGLTGKFGETNNCKPTLAPGASCEVSVVFKPTTKGILTGAISVTDNAPGSPQKLPLSGTGTFVQLKPTSVNFGNQPVHTTSVPKYITLTNQGTATMNISSIVSSGTNSGDFTVTNNCGKSVAVGASCTIKVTFTPSAKGQRTADVAITDDGGGSPQTVPLTGTGTP